MERISINVRELINNGFSVENRVVSGFHNSLQVGENHLYAIDGKFPIFITGHSEIILEIKDPEDEILYKELALNDASMEIPVNILTQTHTTIEVREAQVLDKTLFLEIENHTESSITCQSSHLGYFNEWGDGINLQEGENSIKVKEIKGCFFKVNFNGSGSVNIKIKNADTDEILNQRDLNRRSSFRTKAINLDHINKIKVVVENAN